MRYTFILPIMMIEPRKKTKDRNRWLNMNNYRNWPYQLNNKLKREFSPIATPDHWPGKVEEIKIDYYIHREGKTKYDTMNVACVVDKFFLDWMIKEGMLIDDSFCNVSYGTIVGYNESEKSEAVASIEVIK